MSRIRQVILESILSNAFQNQDPNFPLIARMLAIRDDLSLGDISLTNSNNLKISLSELASALSTNSNTQLNTTIYSPSGVPVEVTANNNQQISLEELAAAISSNSGAQLNITLFDEDGIPASVDDITETLQIIDYSHHEVHSGSHYFYSDCMTLRS